MPDNTLESGAAPHRSLRNRLRTDLYLARLDWHLEGVLPAGERRATVRELRQTLAGDPRDTNVSLGDLGAPKALAARYADDGRDRPLWSMGVITAGAALFIYWTVFLSFALGMLAAVDSNGSAEAHAVFLFVDVTAFSTPDSFGIGWSSGWAWLAVPGVIAALALLLGARFWRIFTALGTRSH